MVGNPPKASQEQGAGDFPSFYTDLMLYIEHDWDGLQFEDISGCGPDSWEAALALHSLSDVPEVAFVTVRLCVLTSFHFMQTPDPGLDSPMGHCL